MQRSSKSKKESLNWIEAPDVEKRVKLLLSKINPNWQKKGKIFFFRSTGSKARAYARIWGLPRIWQQALVQEPAYVIEVISEKFDKLPEKEKDHVLMHELAHIPQTFSGSLVPHFKRGKRKFHDRIKRLQTQFDRHKH